MHYLQVLGTPGDVSSLWASHYATPLVTTVLLLKKVRMLRTDGAGFKLCLSITHSNSVSGFDLVPGFNRFIHFYPSGMLES